MAFCLLNSKWLNIHGLQVTIYSIKFKYLNNTHWNLSLKCHNMLWAGHWWLAAATVTIYSHWHLTMALRRSTPAARGRTPASLTDSSAAHWWLLSQYQLPGIVFNMTIESNHSCSSLWFVYFWKPSWLDIESTLLWNQHTINMNFIPHVISLNF